MKSRVVIIGLICVAVVFLVLIDAYAGDKGEMAGTQALPVALDQFYPPQSPAPAYLLAMLDMSKLLSATACDLLENDLENALLNFESFKKAYIEMSDMIPEWKEKYPIAPVEKMGAAISSGDPSQFMPIMESVGAVCHSCHVNFMAPVQLKYRWENFRDIALTDPLSGRDVSYAELMLMMETNFDGIGNDLSQGQAAQALKQFDGFQARFQAMSDACMTCHNSERLYYVSADVTKKISDLKVELGESQVDMGAVAGLLQAIGQESCTGCHLVHVPAAYGQQALISR
jgi:cytochrome c556